VLVEYIHILHGCHAPFDKLAAKKKLLSPTKRVKILPQGYKRLDTDTPVGFASALRDVLLS
jgi:hypothetical protein